MGQLLDEVLRYVCEAQFINDRLINVLNLSTPSEESMFQYQLGQPPHTEVSGIRIRGELVVEVDEIVSSMGNSCRQLHQGPKKTLCVVVLALDDFIEKSRWL